MNFDDMHEPVELDDYGTVRVAEKVELKSVAVYIKVGDNCWRATYVDTRTGDTHLPAGTVSDLMAGFGKVVFAPKSVERHAR